MILICLMAALHLQAAAATGSIRGTVVDSRGGAPVGDVAVRLQDTGAQAITDEHGRFVFDRVAPGDHELYVSAVDFILVRRAVRVEADAPAEITIALTEGTGTYKESVDVSGAPLEPRREAAVPASQTLAGRELQALRGVLTNDPLRAVQMMPAVAAGDDFRSDFAIRGAGLPQMNFTFEGVATPFLLHTVQQVRDSGSVAMVNGDVLDEIEVSNGSYPQRHGNRTGAEVDFHMREGSRDRAGSRFSASAIDASAVVEGPIGSDKRGSWLATARKSYLNLIADRLYPDQNISFGFADTQAKVVYDVAARHQLQLATTAGRSRLERNPALLTPGNLRDADNQSVLSVFTWRYLASQFKIDQRVAFAANSFTNSSRDGADLDSGDGQELLYRVDGTLDASHRVTLDGGGELRRTNAAGRTQRLLGGQFRFREDFTGSATNASIYLQARVGRPSGRSITPGLRVDRRTLTDTTTVSPWLQAAWPVTSSLTVRAGGGLYRQEPDFFEVLGLRGSRTLGLQHAAHMDVGIEGRLGASSRWQMTLYDREDRRLVWMSGDEPRVANGAFVPAFQAGRYRNALDGYARGFEWLVQRQALSGLSGWASYALGFARYHDRDTGERFWGDLDQRHTINMYGNYRVNDRVSLSARFRAGSNFPVAGYWTARDDRYFLSTERNTVRIPVYARLDARMNRTFTWDERRLTLFLEAINILNRRNLRVEFPSIDRRTFEATGLFASMIPLIPSVGVLLEF